MPRRPAAGTQARPSDADALAHLTAADPVLARLVADYGPPESDEDSEAAGTGGRRTPPGDHYAALLRAIIGQQLSTKAARTIYGRVLDHFGGVPPTPEQVLAADPEEMRAAGGLSRAKAQYLRSLAEHVLSGELELDRLDDLDDETVIAELVAVKGLGVWTSHMFLMFQLDRPDVLAVGDLGVRRGAQIAYGMDELPTPAELTEMAQPWRPHRTMACRILWRSLDNEPA